MSICPGALQVQRTTGNGMAQVDNIIEGHSLINKFGAPGGGAPRDYKDPNHKVLALNMMDVEYGKELEAQNAGTSIFGKAGSGAPLRHPNGQIRSTFPSLHEGFETQELFDEAIGAKLAKQRATLEIEENHTQKIVARRKRHKAADDKAATDAMRCVAPPPSTYVFQRIHMVYFVSPHPCLNLVLHVCGCVPRRVLSRFPESVIQARFHEARRRTA